MHGASARRAAGVDDFHGEVKGAAGGRRAAEHPVHAEDKPAGKAPAGIDAERERRGEPLVAVIA